MIIKWVSYRLWLLCISLGLLSFSVFSADFIGNESCVDCHEKEVSAWQGSDHDMAMKHADKNSVFGDFNNATFEFEGKSNRFFRKGNEYWVNIEGPDGKFHDYKVSYTFGFEPLQQYMVEFEDGRIQLIPFAWDSRSQQAGGQRWYHLYPDMKKTDEFYWTNSGQNWNFMCADCHSTDVKKNYDIKTDTYNTTWSEINVSCESCHGPASEHLVWSNNQEGMTNQHYGFERDLSKSVKEWVFKEGHTTRQPEAIQTTDQITVCAQCHSRRTQLNEDQAHIKGDSKTLLDSYLPSLITAELYHNDGQIYDEDYVYGSFMQSKMAQKGVTCTNCHNPHTTKLDIPEEAVCAQCHIASEYTPQKHTFHEENTDASKCTTCHMPETTYMGVDARRDHSWQIPRPDLSKNIGTPNVCTQCHEDKDDMWADKQVGQWFPDSPYRNQQHFAVAFYASDINYRGAGDALSFTAQDAKQAGIIRGSALQRLGRYPSKNTLVALGRAIKHEDELIRFGAVQGSAGYESHDRWQILSPLLTDKVLGVRSEAAGALVTYWAELNPLQRDQLVPSLNEYINSQLFNSDRGFGRTNLGNVYRSQGKLEQAEQAYLGAIKVEPYFVNSYVNLADMYRMQGKESKGLALLNDGIKAQPNSGALPYSAGLSLLRLAQKEEASQYFKKAAEIEKQNPQYWYVYGLSMGSVDGRVAAQALGQAFELSTDPQHLFAQCDMLLKHDLANAAQCITQLEQYAPKNVIDALKQRL